MIKKNFCTVLLLVILTFLTACSQKQVIEQTSEIKHLQKLEAVASLPEKPTPVVIKQGSKDYGAFDLDGLNKLTAYANQAKANTDAFNTLVKAHNFTIEQHNSIVDYAKQQENRANENYKLYVNEFNDHQNEKKWFTLERLILQLFIVGLAL